MHHTLLISFPDFSRQHGSYLLDNLLKLRYMFHQQTDALYTPCLNGELPHDVNIYFRDYFALISLSLAFGAAARELSPPEQFIDQAIKFNFHFLRFCIHFCRHPSSSFHECAGFSWIGRLLAVEVATDTLAFCLHRSYLANGSLQGIEDGTRICREALRLPNTRSVHRMSLYRKLALLLRSRFSALKHMKDNDDAIVMSLRALELAVDSSDRRNIMHGISQLYHMRYQYTGLPEDKKAAITYTADADQYPGDVGPQPEGQSLMFSQYMNATTLAHNFTHITLQELPQLDAHIASCEYALNNLHLGQHNTTTLRSITAGHLYQRMNASADLRDRVDYGRRCLDHINEALSRVQFSSQILLFKALLLASSKSPYYDLQASLTLMHQIVADEAYTAGDRLNSVYEYWAGPAGSSSTQIYEHPILCRILLDLHIATIHLLPLYASLNLSTDARLRTLAMYTKWLAKIITLHLIDLRRGDLALEIFEECRSVFWSQNLRIRNELALLPQELGRRITECIKRLEEGTTLQVSPPAEKDLSEGQADALKQRRRETAAMFLQLLEQARSYPGLDRFMLPRTYKSLVSVAQNGPVVLLTSFGAASMVVILAPGYSDSGVWRSLPETLSPKFVEDLSRRWFGKSQRARKLYRQRTGLSVGEVMPMENELTDFDCVQSSEDTSTSRKPGKRPSKVKVSDWRMILWALWKHAVHPILSILGLLVSEP